MGFFRFSRRVSIIPGLRVNLGKRGASLSIGHRHRGAPERSPDPSKHVRHRRRFPLSAPRRPNAATVKRRGDLPKRLRPGAVHQGECPIFTPIV